MIVESAIIALCLYGLMRADDILKVAALVSFLAFPAIIMFAEAGASDLVLIVLAIEAVPFAFSLLIMKFLGVRNYKVIWK